MTDTVDTQQAADLLGVQVSTIYAYVSRGILSPLPGAARSRGSRFDRSAVLALVQRRKRTRAGTFEVSIQTSITRIDPAGRLFYRGHDAEQLAATSHFEDVAELLWGTDGCSVWPDAPDAVDPRTMLPGDRIRAAILASGVGRNDDFPTAARRSICAAVASLPTVGADSTGSIAQRLWPKLTAQQADRERLQALEAALVLLADHELATSTVVARATAGTRADPYHVLLAGAAALAGPAHGAASGAAYDALTGSAELHQVPAGFGHLVYRDTDPRFDALIARIEPWAPQVVRRVDDLTIAVRRAHGAAPNVDLALAALSVAADAQRWAGEVIFLIARMAGLAAHGMEELGQPLRFRPQADYVGGTGTGAAGPT
ncbi:citrate synthase [Branchiibius hedensis]|uniref:citrate synthase (unknown stereospecificity) n=1 Tax=Branchiibius hedensis TaxID=672460 RepID=A0A2Y8ZT99_9MICO|nr:citrate synthase [Branchiibius hedensis]PWJ24642.1 citrate synthase [Branchiibius hedensis]SSA33459.1 citrate synthase [Branchiibius hedensis]